jgi:hypothetical protein
VINGVRQTDQRQRGAGTAIVAVAFFFVMVSGMIRHVRSCRKRPRRFPYNVQMYCQYFSF